MKAMIMAAGVGARLMPMTTYIPKPMIPMANRPLMANTVQLLAEHGFRSIIANLHCHTDYISNYFGDGQAFGVSMDYSREEELMGTAGGVKRCDWFLDETFVIISGDALTDIDLALLVKTHKRKGALATLALKEVEDVEHFGIVICSDDGLIKSFQEKPRSEEALSRVANTGIYVFEPEIFKYIPAGQFYDFGKQVFPHLVKAGCPFYGVTVDDYWCDVGNIDRYRQANADVLAGRVRVKTGGRLLSSKSGGRVLLGEGVQVGKSVSFTGTVVIGSGCSIGDSVKISDSVIWNDTIIGDHSTIKGAVIGADCKISSGVDIEMGAVIPSGSAL
ncbi:MAG: mannose-1-phosphate guanyltransferase [Firmicutes bacterium HGW-Firmicutes-15]|nr:MAG: mannose-1-phosphate guanyltransferase [Firmicutes bacterium HGW-Firmicutes-15]